MILACSFLYRGSPGSSALVDLEKLSQVDHNLARKIERQMAYASTSRFTGVREAAAEGYYDIELPYADCQSGEMKESSVNPPQKVEAVVTIFVAGG